MWYQIELVRIPGEGRACTYRIHVKWWSPAFWAECYRTLRAEKAGVAEALWLTLVAVAVFAKRK